MIGAKVFAALAVSAAVVTIAGAGCGSSTHGPKAKPTSRPRQPSLCHLLELPRRSLAKRHLTMADAVERQTDASIGAAGSMLAFPFAMGHHDVGPYGPVLDYLAERSVAESNRQAGRQASQPELTPTVRANASALDNALANGLCR